MPIAWSGAARAAEPVSAYPAGYGSADPLASGASRRMDLSIGRSVVIDLPRDAKEVFVANPGVANAVVRSARKIFLIGVGNGATTVFAMDADGRQIASIDVNVGRDLNVLRQTLRTTLPQARIEIRAAGDSVLLTGTVNSAGDAQQAVDIAKAFVGQTVAGVPNAGGAAVGTVVTGNVINGLTIVGRDQVMLRVTVVEVDRSVIKQLGISTAGKWSTFNVATQSSFPLSLQALSSLNSIGGTASGKGGTGDFIGATLNAFERARVARTLAEPTLVAISGESATFTAGGEIPVPSSATCNVSNTGIGSTLQTPICNPSLAFKPYGINLAFTPVVLSEGRISMRVNTEVTELDPENQFQVGTISVPSFRVRKSSTSIELPSGATMMTAGLLSNTSGSAISGLPVLSNLPVLGALFRSRDYQRRETELMIMVSPFIAKPMESGEAKRPDDGFVETSDPEAVLLGRLNKLYGAAGPSAAPGRTPGRFGFITD
ncbi:MAG: type II and III secretion system protein family protein [Methylobacteriaceae bacterium]|nr:type II and III secretion system protein family protein [Methylobacteriaceae bacterium]